MAFVQSFTLPSTGISYGSTAVCSKPATWPKVHTNALEIQCAKHAQLKGAKKSNRRRPKKHRPSDINRAPPSVDPNPLGDPSLPPVSTLIKAGEEGALAADAEPDVENPEPVAESEELAAESEVPVAESEEPVAKSEEPVVNSDKPAVENEEPVVENNKPTAENKELAVENSTPAVESSAPEVTA